MAFVGSFVSDSATCGRCYTSVSCPLRRNVSSVGYLKGSSQKLRAALPSQSKRRTVRCAAGSGAGRRSGRQVDGKDDAASFFSSLTFESLGISSELAKALHENGITNPTSVQIKAIPAVAGGADVVIGAATGSGKTLAYLLPVLQSLKNQELFSDIQRVPRRPRALILVPTRELAEQVKSVAKALSHHFKFRAVSLVGGSASLKKQKDVLALGPPDVVIATTGRLLQHLEARNIDLLDLNTVVLDEVDTMFDAGFGKEVESILASVKKRVTAAEKTTSIQYIAAGATHPSSAMSLYSKVIPNAKFINVDLHRPPPGLTQKFIDTIPDEKTLELMALLGEAEKDGTLRGGRIIVFTNTTDSCRFVDHFLHEKNFTTSCIHGEMPSELRKEAFLKFKVQETQILVGTDIAARGLDNLKVDHVILFDFPASPVEYIHRAGRTARAGAKGRVTSFVTKRDRTLADAIQEASRDKMDALERANSKRLEADKRKAEEERLNRHRLAKEQKAAASMPYGKADRDSKRKGLSSSQSTKGAAIWSPQDRRGKGKIFRTRISPKRK